MVAQDSPPAYNLEEIGKKIRDFLKTNEYHLRLVASVDNRQYCEKDTESVSEYFNDQREDLSEDALLSGLPRDPSGRPLLGDIALNKTIYVEGIVKIYSADDPARGAVYVNVLPFHTQRVDPEAIKGYFETVKAAARIQSENLSKIFAIRHIGKLQFIVSEQTDGLTAEDMLANVQHGSQLNLYTALHKLVVTSDTPHDGLPEWVVLDCCVSIAEGLTAAHTAGLIHGGIAPQFIVSPRVSSDEGSYCYEPVSSKLAGLGQLTGGRGTPGFTAPEVIRDAQAATTASDVFSVGALMYYLLTGRSPFAGRATDEIYDKTLAGGYEPIERFVPDLSLATGEIIDRCLIGDPEMRYPGGAELLDALDHARDILPQKLRAMASQRVKRSGRTEAPEEEEKPARRSAAWALILLAVLLASGGAVWWFLFESPRRVAQSQYEAAMADAQSAEASAKSASEPVVAKQQWNDARAAYVKALKAKPGDSAAETGKSAADASVDVIDKFIDLLANADRNAVKAKASGSMAVKDARDLWASALNDYTAAHALLPYYAAAADGKAAAESALTVINAFLEKYDAAVEAENAAAAETDLVVKQQLWLSALDFATASLNIIPEQSDAVELVTRVRFAISRQDKWSESIAQASRFEIDAVSQQKLYQYSAAVSSYQSALREYEKALVLIPGSPEAQTGKSRVQTAIDKIQSDLAEFERVKAEATSLSEFATTRAGLEASLAAWTDALSKWRRAEQILPTDVAVISGVREATSTIDSINATLSAYQAAFDDAERLSRVAAETTDYFNVAEHWDVAATAYAAALDIIPDRPEAVKGRQTAMDEASAARSRVATYQQGMSEGAAAESRSATASTVLLRRDDLTQALSHYKISINAIPNDTAATEAKRRIDLALADIIPTIVQYDAAMATAAGLKTEASALSNVRLSAPIWRKTADAYQRALDIVPGDKDATRGKELALSQISSPMDAPVIEPKPEPEPDEKPKPDVTPEPTPEPVAVVEPEPTEEIEEPADKPKPKPKKPGALMDVPSIGLRVGLLAPGIFDNDDDDPMTPEIEFKNAPVVGLFYRIIFSEWKSGMEVGLDAGQATSDDDDVTTQFALGRLTMLYYFESSKTVYFTVGGLAIYEKTEDDLWQTTHERLSGTINVGLGVTFIKKYVDVRATYLYPPVNDNTKGSLLVSVSVLI
ncbi:MAG: protein kinase [Planctomycetota bacterium]